MSRALAKVGDTIIAETDTWETVEGNIYVRSLFFSILSTISIYYYFEH